jgi:hypothetical protein
MRAAFIVLVPWLVACGRTGLVDYPADAGQLVDGGVSDAGLLDAGECDPPVVTRLIPAELRVTADDHFRLWVNGALIDDTPRPWSQPQRYEVRLRADPRARNVIAIEGTNVWNQDSLDRGVAAALSWVGSTGPQALGTDARWLAQARPPAGWQRLDFEDGDWPGATAIAFYGEWPWFDVLGPGVSPPAWLWTYVPSGPASAKPTDETIALRRTFSLDANGVVTSPAPLCP